MQYNVEECYERLKNGIDDTNEMSDFDGGLLYGGAGGPQNGALPGTNATMSPALSRKTSEEQRQRWSHNLDTLSYQPPPYPDPYITTPSPIKSPSHERKISQPSPLSSSFDGEQLAKPTRFILHSPLPPLQIFCLISANSSTK